MKLKSTFVLAAFAIVFTVSNLIAQPYQATWESLDSHKMPEWYDDAKIGLSMHWGVYAVPAWAPRDKGISYAEWYGRRMMEPKNPTYTYHRKKYGESFTYDDFIPMWKAESYKPDEWARKRTFWASILKQPVKKD